MVEFCSIKTNSVLEKSIMWRGIILFFLVLASVAGNKIKIYDSKQEGSSELLKRDARELVEMCFTDNSNPVVISTELLDNNWDPGGNPLIVIDRESNKQITGFLPAFPTYVLPFDLIDNLKLVIDNFQKSKLWNIKSPFLIVETESRCPNTRTILELMLKRDLLNVYYLCDNKNSTVVFTLNPYANFAPAPWVLIAKFGDTSKKLTLFRLEYTKDPEICKSITFDKTDRLEGTDINILDLYTYGELTEEAKKRIVPLVLKNKMGIESDDVFHISALINTTVELDLTSQNLTILLKQGYIQQLVNNTDDVFALLVPMEATHYDYSDIITSYHERECSILTKKTDFITVINEVTNNLQFVIKTIVLLIMLTITMVIINRDDIRLAMMDMVRLVSGMALESPLDRLAMKFILFCGVLLSLLVIPEFQGHVSAILTTPLGRNIETLEDLHENKFHVLYDENLEHDIISEQLWITDEDKTYLHPMSGMQTVNCWREARKNSSIACVQITNWLLEIAADHSDLYASKEIVLKKLFVNWARKNWPLKDQFDKISLKLSEVGFDLRSIGKNYNDRSVEKIKKMRIMEESEKYDQFDFDAFIYICYIFGFIIVFAIMILGIETIFSLVLRIYRQF